MGEPEDAKLSLILDVDPSFNIRFTILDKDRFRVFSHSWVIFCWTVPEDPVPPQAWPWLGSGIPFHPSEPIAFAKSLC